MTLFEQDVLAALWRALWVERNRLLADRYDFILRAYRKNKKSPAFQLSVDKVGT